MILGELYLVIALTLLGGLLLAWGRSIYGARIRVWASYAVIAVIIVIVLVIVRSVT